MGAAISIGSGRRRIDPLHDLADFGLVDVLRGDQRLDEREFFGGRLARQGIVDLLGRVDPLPDGFLQEDALDNAITQQLDRRRAAIRSHDADLADKSACL